MASCKFTSVISVCEDLRDGGHWVLTSENLAGLLLSGKNLKALRADVPDVIKMLFKLNYDMDVHVCPVSEPHDIGKTPVIDNIPNPLSWTAVPTMAA